MKTAAVELAVGILLGLYECRDAGSETLLEYSPDYAAERAADVVDQCRKLGVVLPIAELFDLLPEWSGILGRHARQLGGFRLDERECRRGRGAGH